MFPRIAARQTPINLRFALPGGAAGAVRAGQRAASSGGDATEDTARGRRPRRACSIAARRRKTCPKVIEAFGSAEFWGLRMSPGLIGTDAKRDIPLPDNVRRYYYPGTTHGGGRGGFASRPSRPDSQPAALPANPNPEGGHDARVDAGADRMGDARARRRPPSRYPRLANGELVPATRKPRSASLHVPGCRFSDRLLNPVLDYDFGPGFVANDLSGVIVARAAADRAASCRPTCRASNADGNETPACRRCCIRRRSAPTSDGT